MTVLFVRYGSERWREVAFDIATIGAASAAGISIYVAQTLLYPWIREVNSLNHYAGLPAQLLSALGIPVLLGILFLLLGFPRQNDIKATALKIWFVTTLVVVYAPKVPWSLHFLDGFYFVVGLLVMYQARDLVRSWRLSFPSKHRPAAVALVACIFVIALAPHFTFRWIAWSDGVRTTTPIFRSAIAPREESALIDWFRKNSSPDLLVLAPRDQAPWIATAPVHSFGAHWLCSLLTPSEEATWTAFYSGELTAPDAATFLGKYGFSFVVVPGESPAIKYTRNRAQRVERIGDFEIFKIPNGGMREKAVVRGNPAPLVQAFEVHETASPALR